MPKRHGSERENMGNLFSHYLNPELNKIWKTLCVEFINIMDLNTMRGDCDKYILSLRRPSGAEA